MDVTKVAKAGALGKDMSPESSHRKGVTGTIGPLSARDFAEKVNMGMGKGAYNDVAHGAKSCKVSNFITDTDMPSGN